MPEPHDHRRVKIAWAVTIAEFILFVAALGIFLQYWIMLPVKYRAYGVAGLSAAALIGIYRIVRLYRKGR